MLNIFTKLDTISIFTKSEKVSRVFSIKILVYDLFLLNQEIIFLHIIFSFFLKNEMASFWTPSII
jgi:hypothetical protein